MATERLDEYGNPLPGAGEGWGDKHGPFYLGIRSAARLRVTRIDVNGTTIPLRKRQDIRNHSPDGFEWGYGGSGPAQLALALCADALGDDARAEAVHQRFKSRVVGRLHKDGWALSAAEVRRVVAELEAERQDANPPPDDDDDDDDDVPTGDDGGVDPVPGEPRG